MISHLFRYFRTGNSSKLKAWWYQGTDPKKNYPLIRQTLNYLTILGILAFAVITLWFMANPQAVIFYCSRTLLFALLIAFSVIAIKAAMRQHEKSIFLQVAKEQRKTDIAYSWRVVDKE